MSTLLLVPHVTPGGDERLWAALGESLGRHAPETDTEAKILLELVKPLVVQKNTYVWEGCHGLILARHQAYLKDHNFAGAAVWLLRGLEIDKAMYWTNDGERGRWETLLACGSFARLLCRYCLKISLGLLSGLRNLPEDGVDKEVFVQSHFMASETVKAVRQDELSDSVANVREFKTLCDFVDIANSRKQKNSDHKIAAKVVSCLEETPDSDDKNAVVLSQCHPTFWKDLFLIAVEILQRDQVRFGGGKKANFQSCFDARGIRVLMTTYLKLQLRNDIHNAVIGENIDKNAVNLALSTGLATAFVTENAKRKSHKTTSSFVDHERKDTPLHLSDTLSPSEQDRLISRALGDLY
uniref:Nuclear pore complex protein Nup85 n=1 Tax=Cyclophora tenuis TaxID=216820 RepID=A0A7S1GJW5_CYCTE